MSRARNRLVYAVKHPLEIADFMTAGERHMRETRETRESPLCYVVRVYGIDIRGLSFRVPCNHPFSERPFINSPIYNPLPPPPLPSHVSTLLCYPLFPSYPFSAPPPAPPSPLVTLVFYRLSFLGSIQRRFFRLRDGVVGDKAGEGAFSAYCDLWELQVQGGRREGEEKGKRRGREGVWK